MRSADDPGHFAVLPILVFALMILPSKAVDGDRIASKGGCLEAGKIANGTNRTCPEATETTTRTAHTTTSSTTTSATNVTRTSTATTTSVTATITSSTHTTTTSSTSFLNMTDEELEALFTTTSTSTISSTTFTSTKFLSSSAELGAVVAVTTSRVTTSREALCASDESDRRRRRAWNCAISSCDYDGVAETCQTTCRENVGCKAVSPVPVAPPTSALTPTLAPVQPTPAPHQAEMEVFHTTVLSGSTQAGATSVMLADITGIEPGHWLTLSDGGNSETVEVASVQAIRILSDQSNRRMHTAGTVTLTTPLQNAYSDGATVEVSREAQDDALVTSTSRISSAFAANGQPTEEVEEGFVMTEPVHLAVTVGAFVGLLSVIVLALRCSPRCRRCCCPCLVKMNEMRDLPCIKDLDQDEEDFVVQFPHDSNIHSHVRHAADPDLMQIADEPLQWDCRQFEDSGPYYQRPVQQTPRTRSRTSVTVSGLGQATLRTGTFCQM